MIKLILGILAVSGCVSGANRSVHHPAPATTTTAGEVELHFDSPISNCAVAVDGEIVYPASSQELSILRIEDAPAGPLKVDVCVEQTGSLIAVDVVVVPGEVKRYLIEDSEYRYSPLPESATDGFAVAIVLGNQLSRLPGAQVAYYWRSTPHSSLGVAAHVGVERGGCGLPAWW